RLPGVRCRHHPGHRGPAVARGRVGPRRRAGPRAPLGGPGSPPARPPLRPGPRRAGVGAGDGAAGGRQHGGRPPRRRGDDRTATEPVGAHDHHVTGAGARGSHGDMAPLLPVAADHPGSLAAELTTLGDRRVVLVEIASDARRGAISEADGHVFAAAARHAATEGLPLVGLIASSGADVHDGVAALHGWGRAARALADCSGRVPVLLAATGPVVSGPALLLGLADQVVLTADAYAFVSGPRMVETFTGESLDTHELGGAGVHTAATGLAALLVPDRAAALDALTDLLAYLPSNADELPPRWPCADPPDRPTPEAGACIPASPTGGYDVRDVIRAIVDDGELLELRARWAPNLVTALTVIDGRPVGVVANQPVAIAGTL